MSVDSNLLHAFADFVKTLDSGISQSGHCLTFFVEDLVLFLAGALGLEAAVFAFAEDPPVAA